VSSGTASVEMSNGNAFAFLFSSTPISVAPADQRSRGMRHLKFQQRRQRSWPEKAFAARRVIQPARRGQRLRESRALICRPPAAPRSRAPRPESAGSQCSGTDSRKAGRSVLPAPDSRCGYAPQERHHKPRRAVTALRAVVLDHRALRGMPGSSLRQTIDRHHLRDRQTSAGARYSC